MQYKIEINHFLGNKEGIGSILIDNIVIGSFSFEFQSEGAYLHYLEINKEFQGQKRLFLIAQEIKSILKKNLFFHAQDLNDPNRPNEKLCNYYQSLGFVQIHDNYFKFC